MIDEKLDTNTHDLAYENFDEQLVSGVDQVRQNILIRLLFVKGEYWLNPNLGCISFDMLSTKVNVQPLLDAAIKSTIVSTPEVISLLNYSSTLINRSLNVVFSVLTEYGTISNEPVQISAG